MTDYAVLVSNRAARELEALASQPRPSGVKKLQGERDLWRIRIGEYRVIYSVNDRNRVVDVVRVRHRSKAYE